MEIDIRTLAIVLVIIDILQSVAFLFQYLTNKNYRGISWWVLGSSCAAAGYLLLFLRDTVPSALVTIIIANTLLVTGLLCIYIGIARFLDQRENRRVIGSIIVLFLAVFFYFTYASDNITARTAIISVAIAIISLWIGLSLLGEKPRSITTSAHAVAAVFLAYGGFFVFRTVEALVIAPVDTLFTPTLIQIATFLISLVQGILMTVGLIIMVNQRLNAEMSEAKEEFELIFNTSPDAALITRLDDGTIVNINEGFSAITGYTRNESIGRTIFDINVWKDPAERMKITSELQEKGFCENFEVTFLRKDKSELSGLVSAKTIVLQGVLHIISVTRDITERKRAEVRLHESETRFRQLVEATVEGIVIHKAGIIRDFNERACELFGYSRGEMIGRNVLTLAAPGFVEIVRQKVVAGEEEPYEAEGIRKDGTTFWAEMRSRQIIVDSEMLRITTLWDITERKRVEDALHLANNKLTILNSITRHDILNQLMALQTFLELSKEEVKDALALEYIRKEEEVAEAIQWQIEFTRDYQDIGAQASKWQYLAEIIGSATKQLKPVDVEIAVTVNRVEIFADPLIGKVFYNLMENSLRHGDHVTRMSFSVQETGNGITVIYCDNGAGIAAEDKKKLFLKGFGKHTGLGLFLSKEILSMTGITIQENGEPGKGVRFEIMVPKGMWRAEDTGVNANRS
jgi:PAS domain S-box-containing protein